MNAAGQAESPPAPWATNTSLPVPIDTVSHWFHTVQCAYSGLLIGPPYGDMPTSDSATMVVTYGEVVTVALQTLSMAVDVMDTAVSAKLQDGTLTC